MKYFYIIALSICALAPKIAKAQSSNHPLNPLGDTSGGVPEIAGRILRVLLGFSSIAALTFFIIGGITLLTSQGNSEKIQAGKNTILWAIIGMLVAFSSYILIRFVVEIIIGSVQ